MIKDINNIDPKLLEEDDRIVSFLKGQMSAEEESKFIAELNENQELKEKAIITARLVKGLKEVGSMQDRDIIGAFMASSEHGVNYAAKEASRIEEAAYAMEASAEKVPYIPSEVPAASRSKVVPMRRAAKWMSIAASLFFIVWLGVEYSMYRRTTSLGEQYGNQFESSMIVRGAEGQSEAAKKLENLFADVKKNENIDDAIHELSLYWELSQMETYNDYTDYSSEIGWNLAIAYLKDNNKKEAKKVLEKLIATSEEGSAIYNTSTQLLEKL